MSCVYFIQQGKRGPIKIGRSADAESRLQDLQVGSAWELRIRRVIETDRAHELERLLHRIFAYHRLSGEWFAPGEDVEEFITSGRDWPEPALTRIARAWGPDPDNVVSLDAARFSRFGR